jgi:SAM-dependent methyltransferase
MLGVGVEPSRALSEAARAQGLQVVTGTLEQLSAGERFDWVCAVDVLEHVLDPAQLLRSMDRFLAPGGRVLLVTPDLGSAVARLLGRRWWHFRVAHVGYFRRATLDRLVRQTGWEVEQVFRPAWWFPLGYVWERLGVYLPVLSRIRLPAGLARRTVALNLFDSWGVVCKKKGA